MLESKDKDQLLAIAQALGITTNARAAKATLISKILETTGPGPSDTSAPEVAASNGATSNGEKAAATTPAKPAAKAATAGTDDEVIVGPDGEPLANWEIELIKKGEVAAPTGDAGAAGGDDADDADGDDGDDADDADGNDGQPGGQGDGESRNARRRRRRRGKPRTDGPQGYDRQERYSNDRGERPEGNEPQNYEPVSVAGYLDLREEGYGFLRVTGYLASREDAYIPVKLTRQYGLRKGDHVTGLSRPAGRNEKNPALLEIHTVNGDEPEKARNRRRFEDLTALFPDEKLSLEHAADPGNMTARIVDLVSPIGKGQRGIIVSPPKAGKTTIMKTIATSIEANNPEVKLIVLLIDERPEEVTDMRRTVKGEVISSTFDRPSDEHTQVAELALEKAKRLVEGGHDVVIILDGITRLSRAYNLAAPASGRILSGGIDAGALYPPKRFFGAARNVEEGGSLTILATALVETNSRMDEAIFEEFKGTGNMELRLDRRLAERRIYPAIDVDASSTRHEELLFDRKQLQMVWKLRRVLSGLAADGNAAPGLELLMDRLRTFRTNDEFLNEIAKQPTM
ncbi:MAG: transcription termination factor Rho [Actinobacteria bacterium]|nr:transcription termination factor Rho [Actinomycetota bacterium]